MSFLVFEVPPAPEVLADPERLARVFARDFSLTAISAMPAESLVYWMRAWGATDEQARAAFVVAETLGLIRANEEERQPPYYYWTSKAFREE